MYKNQFKKKKVYQLKIIQFMLSFTIIDSLLPFTNVHSHNMQELKRIAFKRKHFVNVRCEVGPRIHI